LATARILAKKEAIVHVLDINQFEEVIPGVQFHKCNIASWEELRSSFDKIGHVDYAFANAGVSEEADYFADQLDAEGRLVEPTYRVLDVNVRGVYNLVKLAWSRMRKDQTPGSIVITTSASGYAPEQSLPVYSSGKLAVSNTDVQE
jgi:NAD(P)-dependent dehydrogenase (short-subunit alcohol dehydrogenase family)